MQRATRSIVVLVFALLASALLAGGALADGGHTTLEERLLYRSEGLQMPGSEADSGWWFVSYPGEGGLPTAERMAELSGCSDFPAGVVARLDFDAYFGSLGTVQPWMDPGQRESARGFRRLGRVFHRRYGEDLAVYRCETGTAEVYIYFIGANDDGVSGLLTINIET